MKNIGLTVGATVMAVGMSLAGATGPASDGAGAGPVGAARPSAVELVAASHGSGSRAYTRGFRLGYRAGFPDGVVDGRDACRRGPRVAAEAAGRWDDFQRGYTDGYDRGYTSGFALGCRPRR